MSLELGLESLKFWGRGLHRENARAEVEKALALIIKGLLGDRTLPAGSRLRSFLDAAASELEGMAADDLEKAKEGGEDATDADKVIQDLESKLEDANARAVVAEGVHAAIDALKSEVQSLREKLSGQPAAQPGQSDGQVGR